MTNSTMDTIKGYLPDKVTGDQYPVTAVIKKTREGKDKFIKDRARRITTDKGLQKYELKNEDEETKQVPYDHIHNVSGEDYVFIESPTKGHYEPFLLETGDDGTITVSGSESEWDTWSTITAMEERQDWKEPGSWIEENKELVAFGVIGLGVLLSQVGSAYYISSVLDGMQPLADAFTTAAQTIADSQIAG